MRKLCGQLISIRNVFLTLLLVFAWVGESHAIVQIRGHYGFGQTEGRYTVESPSSSTFGLDAIVSLPLIPFVFGGRYESFNSKEETPSLGEEKVTLSRISGLVGYRLLDTLMYVGALGTFGLIHDGDIEIAGVSTDLEMDFSASVAAEAGVKLNSFIIGAELGYFLGRDKDQGDNYDFNGVYGKVHLGYDF